MHTKYSNEKKWFIQIRNAIYYILGVIEVLLVFRLIFRLLGANTSNPFVVFLYSITKLLIIPFIGIFKAFTANGASGFVFEPATIIAMVVYAITAYGVVSLVRLKTVNT
ncbi:MAG: YggT family protein [Clostridia bacterium]|nr:YggT family protein [Clostridia bacterium]